MMKEERKPNRNGILLKKEKEEQLLFAGLQVALLHAEGGT